jgi:hypothetical protein
VAVVPLETDILRRDDGFVEVWTSRSASIWVFCNERIYKRHSLDRLLNPNGVSSSTHILGNSNHLILVEM